MRSRPRCLDKPNYQSMLSGDGACMGWVKVGDPYVHRHGHRVDAAAGEASPGRDRRPDQPPRDPCAALPAAGMDPSNLQKIDEAVDAHWDSDLTLAGVVRTVSRAPSQSIRSGRLRVIQLLEKLASTVAVHAG